MPEKRVVPRMPNKKIQKATITIKLAMLGTEFIREMIDSLSPLFLEMSLRGLKILSIRRALRKLILY